MRRLQSLELRLLVAVRFEVILLLVVDFHGVGHPHFGLLASRLITLISLRPHNFGARVGLAVLA